MADYVETLFLGDLIDSDGGGVPDYLDKCPQTPIGAEVDASGCPVTILDGSAVSWSFDEITFESGKAELSKSSFYPLGFQPKGLARIDPSQTMALRRDGRKIVALNLSRSTNQRRELPWMRQLKKLLNC